MIMGGDYTWICLYYTEGKLGIKTRDDIVDNAKYEPKSTNSLIEWKHIK